MKKKRKTKKTLKKRKFQLDANQIAAKVVQHTIQESEK